MNRNKADGIKKSIGHAFNKGELDKSDLNHIAAYCLEKSEPEPRRDDE